MSTRRAGSLMRSVVCTLAACLAGSPRQSAATETPRISRVPVQVRTVAAGPPTGHLATPEGKVSVIVKLAGASLPELVRASGPTVAAAGRVDVRSSHALALRAAIGRRLSELETSARRVSPDLEVMHRFDAVLGGVSLLVREGEI